VKALGNGGIDSMGASTTILGRLAIRGKAIDEPVEKRWRNRIPAGVKEGD